MEWNKEEHDFGDVRTGTTVYTDFLYKGEDKISFRVSCGCTTPTYDKETKILNVGLRVDGKGTKTSTVTINGNKVLILKANGI